MFACHAAACRNDRRNAMSARMLANVVAIVAIVLGSPARSADVDRGRGVYQTYCVACHGGPGTVGGAAIAAGAGRPEAISAAMRSVPDMNVLSRVLGASDIDDVAAYLAVLFGAPPTPVASLVAVEYYHAGLDHYFTTAIPAEIGALDTGTGAAGWVRTGGSFHVWRSVAEAPADASPVCRVYLPPAFGNSHFYSASPPECADVRARFPAFVVESDEVMAVHLPDAATGACPDGMVPVYRVWNMRADTNHRFTIDRDLRAKMIGRGFVPEGYGPEGVAFCAPT
jgi:mono/diheme cytochrome c family protein